MSYPLSFIVLFSKVVWNAFIEFLGFFDCNHCAIVLNLTSFDIVQIPVLLDSFGVKISHELSHTVIDAQSQVFISIFRTFISMLLLLNENEFLFYLR